MATEKTVSACSVRVGIQTGTDDAGKAIISKSTYSRVNPAITDDNARIVATNDIAALQSGMLASVERIDYADLEEGGGE